MKTEDRITGSWNSGFSYETGDLYRQEQTLPMFIKEIVNLKSLTS